MPGDDHATITAERRAGDDGVTVPAEVEVVELSEARPDRIGDAPLVARHRFDVAELTSDVDG